jgi:hypothetical protein
MSSIAIAIFSYRRVKELGDSVFFSWNSSSYIAQGMEALNNESFNLGPALISSFGNLQFPHNFALIPEFAIAHRFSENFPEIFYATETYLFFS